MLPVSNDPLANYNSMQQSAGIIPPFGAVAPMTPTSAQVSAGVAAMGAQQLSQMMAISQMSQQSSGMFNSPSFPQLRTPFIGMPGMMQGPNNSLYSMTPAGAYSPYQQGNYGNYGGSGQAGQMSPPGNMYSPTPPPPPPMYRGPMGQPNFAPLSPPPPLSMFDTPYQAAIANAAATSDRGFAGGMTNYGLGARLGADAALGSIGARVGGRYGGRMGAAAGAALGFVGSEVSGLGNMAQNAFMENVALPAMNTRAYGSGLENVSRGFVSGGSEMSNSGSGWSKAAATRAAAGLEQMAQSTSFQKETFNRFNTADVMRIGQASGQEGLLSGVQTGSDMKSRVREISKSLTSVMELANEPDVLRAIQVMGQMRSSGLGLGETTRAVQNGRSFARMAGTSFEGLANTGGAMGSSAFQSLGLTQGLGMTTGMANTGMAMAAQNTGMSPQMMNLMGGAHGMAGLNTMFSAGMLQMPMMAPGMMTSGGGINLNNMRGMMSGRMSAFDMTSAGSSTMSAMGQGMGVGGLGMALGMQPLLQDTVGRMVQSQGPFAQRHMEDRQIMSLSRNMGLRGSEGFMTAAQMMGMNGTQAMARAQELGDPRTHSRRRQQIEVNRRERRTEELRDNEAREPGFMQEMEGLYAPARDLGSLGRSISRGAHSISSAFTGSRAASLYSPTSRDDHSRLREMAGSSEYWDGLRGRRVMNEVSSGSRFDRAMDVASLHGGRGITSVLGGLGKMAMGHDIEGESRAFRETGRFMSTALNSSRQSQDAALGRTNELFGNRENMLGFTGRVAQLYGDRGFGGGAVGGAINLGMQVGASRLTNNLLDMGGIVGTKAVTLDAMRGAYVTQMRGHNNMNAAQLGQHFDQNRSTIATQMGSELGGYMTVEQRARMRSETTAMSNLGPGGRGRNAQAAEADAYRELLGDGADSTSTRRRADQLFQFTGFGANQQERGKSATYMATRAALQAQLQGETSPDGQRRVQQQLRELDTEGRRRGIDVRQANRNVDARSDSLQGDGDLRDALRGRNLGRTGADALNTMTRVHGARDTATMDTTMQDGIRRLSGRDGVVGSMFQGVIHDGEIDRDKLQEQMRTVGGDPGKMRELAARNPAMAEMVRQYSTGNERQRNAAFSRFGQSIAAEGETARSLRTEYGQRGPLGRAWERIKSGGLSLSGIALAIPRGIMGMAQSEDSYVSSRTGAGTSADEVAGQQTSDSAAMEGEARGAGMGGASDKLLQASEQLLRAAQAFQGGASEQTMNGLFPAAR